jgi:hypothetical protein
VGLDDDTHAEITGGALRAGDAVIVAESEDRSGAGPAAPGGAGAMVPLRR